jgi:hypothetical protein
VERILQGMRTSNLIPDEDDESEEDDDDLTSVCAGEHDQVRSS